MWVDPNLNDFYTRVTRIEKAHAKGYGFEAPGTLGRSALGNRKTRNWKFLKPLALVLLTGAGMKGVIHYYIGAETYQLRVDALAVGQGFDPVGGWLMQADPVTLWISGQIGAVLPR